ncbi:MAG: DNA mismatch repair endonuclease MutL [Clostridia bacterium]|nr:DNA mismatch repair endonuclease MutL [Clostridia bacterium]
MANINVLDKKVYNRIAAGEVVERPYSVVKELVENSIDAGATEITVSIYNGGKTAIEVSDNGCGIDKNNLKKALMPHATSKILNSEDLEHITTLGFRGEALPSIASVAKIEICSKPEGQEIGYTIISNGGDESEVEECPCNTGTFITVSNLFFNTPARLKFLKSDKSEENDVTDMMARLVLANPEISFKYYVDGEIVTESYGDGVEDSLISVYGLEAVKNSFKISNYLHGVKIEGYVGKHNYTKPNRTYQTTILNGRYVVNSTIQSAVHNAYSSYLMKRRYPFYVLYVTMPKEVVDVNVTPNKSDVRFLDNSIVYGAIYSTISKVLDGTDSAVNIVLGGQETVYKSPQELKEETLRAEKDEVKVVLGSLKNSQITINTPYKRDNFNFNNQKVFEDKDLFLDEAQNQTSPKNDVDIFAENKRYIAELERKKQEAEQAEFAKPNKLEYRGQILNSYLIFDNSEDMYIIDQHAAHERLLYNKFILLQTTKSVTIQDLLVPFTMSLNGNEENFLKDKLIFLEEIGFSCTITDGILTVYSVPLEFVDINLVDFFAEIMEDYSFRHLTVPNVINEKIIMKACKSAIKAGMQLDKSEVDSLMRLLDGNINLKCPHGRPIAIRVTRYEIDKWFKRIV